MCARVIGEINMLSIIWKAFLGREAQGLRQTIEVFRENAEKAAGRDHALQQNKLPLPSLPLNFRTNRRVGLNS